MPPVRVGKSAGRVGLREPVAPPARGSSGMAVRAVEATKVYGSGQTAITALASVSIELPAGQFTAIMGPSGSGTSTLLHCLAGLDRLTSARCSSARTGSWQDAGLRPRARS
jgi:ABC-type sulfate/molybdate transport systems ATPase subunit